jgi:hypothetical protein
MREDWGVNRLLVVLVVSVTVAGCSLGEDEPETAVAGSQFVTELIRLGSDDAYGRVGLSAVGDKTRVVVEVSEPTGQREAEIHDGNCDVLGTAVYGLEPLRQGVSTTVLDIGLGPLRRMGYAVIVPDAQVGLEAFAGISLGRSRHLPRPRSTDSRPLPDTAGSISRCLYFLRAPRVLVPVGYTRARGGRDCPAVRPLVNRPDSCSRPSRRSIG